MITIIKFYLLLLAGTVSRTGDNEGIHLYTIKDKETHIEYAYKEEVLHYIETGEFLYNDFLVFE